ALGLRRWAAANDVPPPLDFAGVPAGVIEHLTAAYRDARAHPTSAAAVGSLGMAYHADLFPAHAAAAYGRAMALQPDDWRWRYSLALLAADRGDVRAAADVMRSAVALDPNLAIGWWRLGEAELKQGHDDAARMAYDRARALPQDTAGRRGRGVPISVF